MNIEKKLFLVTIVPMIVVFAVIVFLTEFRVKSGFKQTAYSYTDIVGEDAAADIKTSINENVLSVNLLRSTIETFYQENSVSRDMLNSLLLSYAEDVNAFAVGIHLEKDAVESDSSYAGTGAYDETGQYYFYMYKSEGKNILTTLPYDDTAHL